MNPTTTPPPNTEPSAAPELAPAPRDRVAARAGAAVALLLFAAAIWLVNGPLAQSRANPADALAAADPALVYIADLDFWQRTPREMAVLANAHFDLDHNLADLPLQVGTWTGESRPEQNQEVLILLDPEQYEQRLYRDADGFPMWLSLVGGRSSQPFHAPDICYDADGWQYSLGSWPVELEDGGSLWGLYLTAQKEKPDPINPDATIKVEHVVFYFYLFPDGGRSLEDGLVLFKLTSSLTGSVEETLDRQADFVRQFFSQAATVRPESRSALLPAAAPYALRPSSLF